MQRALRPSDRTIQDLLSKKQLTQAIPLIEKRLAEFPEEADSHYYQGVLWYFQGKLGNSLKALQKALEINPKHTDTAICLSVLLNDIGKYSDARKVFEQANQSVAHAIPGEDLEIDRKFAIKHLEIADMYYRYRRYEDAIDEYSKSLSLDPTQEDTRVKRAKAFAKKGFVTRAMQELQTLKSENPHNITARLQLGLLHYSQNNVLDAELEWENALDLEPGNKEARSYLEMAKSQRAF